MNKRAPQTADVSNPPRITVPQPHREYQANVLAADQKYTYKWIIVTGTVESIETILIGSPSLRLKATNAFNHAFVTLGPNQQNTVAQLNKGAKVTLRCQVTNFIIGSLNLDECTFTE